jgi:hypothetical protein
MMTDHANDKRAMRTKKGPPKRAFFDRHARRTRCGFLRAQTFTEVM